jgi:DNA polymerase
MPDVATEGLKHALESERRVEPKSNLRASWEALMKEARGCRRCELYKCGTQTVFGEGPLDARIVFVGEQPGDQEDLAGRPFVGPAGQLFDQLLEKAGVDRSKTYVTNAVKHFKFVQRGKRRIHSKPDASVPHAAPRGVMVSREAVKDNGRTGTVFVIKDDNTLEKREVPLGPRVQQSVTLMSGVASGERLVSGDLTALKEGMRVAVQE